MTTEITAIEKLEQGTEEWLAWRKQGLGASDIPAIMQTSPWKTIRELWLDKTNQSKPQEQNDAMRRGVRLEPFARDEYNGKFLTNMIPKLFIHPGHKVLRASLDGFDDEKGFGIEIKCSSRKDVDQAKRGKVPAKYYPQLQMQMACSMTNKIDYVVYDETNVHVVTVAADPQYQRRMVRYALWFWSHVEKIKDPGSPKLRHTQIDDIQVEA